MIWNLREIFQRLHEERRQELQDKLRFEELLKKSNERSWNGKSKRKSTKSNRTT
jgi:hypothetical protein